MKTAEIVSASAEATVELGRRVARRLKAGDVVALIGPVGSGKTTFARGMAEGLGIRVDASEVVSPTFVLVKEYPCRVPFYHVDLYRLDRLGGTDAALLAERIYGKGVTAVEWAEKAAALLPERRLEAHFRHLPDGSRGVRFIPQGGFPAIE